MKSKYKILMLWIGLLLGATRSMAAVVTTAGTGSVCPDNEVVIPITVSNCDGVSAISLALNFDNTKITYQGFQNVNSQVASMLVNQSNGRIYITWASLNAINLGNATLLELRFTGISGTSSLTWQTNLCEYSNAVGSAIQSTYTNGSVTVYGVPNITTQPTDKTVSEGHNTTISVTASGQGLNYQWQMKTPINSRWQNVTDDGHHANMTSRQLSINNATMQMHGNQYRCLVSGTCSPAVVSEPATLTVNVFIPTIVTTIGTIATCPEVTFSVPVSVTNCNNVGAVSLALNYNANLVSYIGYENAHEQLGNGMLQVNASDGTLYFTWASTSSPLNIGEGALVNFLFESQPGNSSFSWNTAYCEYSNMNGNSIPSSFVGSNLTAYLAPAITAHPVDKTIGEGTNTTFSVTATGHGLTYQWQLSQDNGISWENLSNGAHYGNVNTRTLNVNNVLNTMNGYRYRCLVSGTCPPDVASEYAMLHVTAFVPTIVTTIGSLNTCSGSSFSIPVSVINCNNVGAISLALAYNSDVLTYEGCEGLHPALNGGQMQINATNGYVYFSWISLAGANVGDGNLFTIDFMGNPGSSTLAWNMSYSEFSNVLGQHIPATFTNGSVTVGDSNFSISTQPEDQTVMWGENTTFAVETTSQGLSYQWQVSGDGGVSWSNLVAGTHYSNVQTATLGINDAVIEMNGCRYRCVVTGSCGIQYSDAAILTVDLPYNLFEITVSANPTAGGSVTGAGVYETAQTCTVTATANTGYEFVNWTENGVEVSRDPSYSFLVQTYRNLVANFSVQTITVTTQVQPYEGGTISGSGTYNYGAHVLLTATPSDGFGFSNWTENGSVISTNRSISFTAVNDRSLVANFIAQLPELHVTGITHSDMIAGQQVTVGWTVQNDGLFSTPNGALWHDYVWLSVESRVAAGDNNPILLGTFDNLSALEPGEYYTQTQTFTLPLELVGSYYLFVLTDAYDCHTIYWGPEGVPLPYAPPPYLGCLSHHCYSNCPNVADNRIYEQSEYDYGEAPGGYYNDNFFYTLVNIAVPPLPDLQVTGIIPPDNFFSGTNVAVTATIKNMGDHVTYSSNWTDALFIASEPDINSPTAVCLDVKQHSVALGAGQTYQVHLSGRVPLTMYGEAYFFVYTDCYNQVYEHTLSGNNITMSNPVNIVLSPPADLVPTIVTAPNTISTAESFTYSFRVNNVGAGHTNGDNWVDKVYLSQNPNALDGNAILLKTHNRHGKLYANGYYTVNETLSLPNSVAAGNYYLCVYADADNSVFEYLYDDNNVAYSSAIEITQPDLQVTQINAPEQITSGYPMNLSYTLANNGNGIINNRNVADRICISASGSMTDTIGLATVRRNLTLQPGQSLTVMCNDLAPYNLNEGTYHLIVVTDNKHQINESDEGNNTLHHYPMPIMHQPLPDLEPISLTLPDVVQAGEAIPVQFDVTNTGDMDLIGSYCTFNIYAAWGDNEILCPVQSQTLPLGNTVSIGVGETAHFVRSILVPPTVTSSCTTFNLVVDKENLVTELDTLNNVFTTFATVLDSPLPDLGVTNIALSELQSGAYNQLSYSVSNTGTADFEGSFNTSIYVRSATDTILCPLVQQMSPEEGNYSIPVGSTVSFTQQVLVPPMVNAYYYLLDVVVDEDNVVLESNDNNNTTSTAAMISNYPFDLKTVTLQATDTVWAGETASLSWKVKNIGTCPSEAIPLYVNMDGNYRLVEGETMPTVWVDKVYVSDDPVWDEGDQEVYAAARSTVLHPDATYSVEQAATIPYTHLGSQYLICVSDATRVTYDSDTTNNVKAIPVEIQLGALPDLRITALTVDTLMNTANTYQVRYTVTNEGERVTQTNTWTDAFYVSEFDFMFGALQLGSKIHHGALEVGESYTDSVEILIPNGLEGDYYMLGFIDKTNQIFENEGEDNNLFPLPVTIMAPAPCDLIAIQPDFPTSIVSGGEMTISWQLRNVGSNPATGRIRNAVYLSTDAEWSSDDKMLGYADMNINIAANGEQSCQLNGSITGFDEGSYYVVVKANILNALNESTYENNICVSMLTTDITFPTLAIGETIERTILPERNIYYKIEVGAEYEGQTLLCQIVSLDNNVDVSNGLYISHGSVPTPIDFDYGVFVPYSHEQEILIPSLEQGTYYLMVQGAAFEIGHLNNTVINRNLVPIQNILISASIVNFEILSVNANHGSNMGSVTTKVTGAKFEDVMDIRLVQGDEYLPAQKVHVNNSSEAYVTFDLTEMPLGTYTMEAELPGGVITVKEDAFIVEEGVPSELMLRLLVPASVRSGNTFPVTLEYGNTGYTDLNVIGFKVVSHNGHPIGSTAEELQEGKTERMVYVRDNGVHYLNGMNPGFMDNHVLIMKATPSSNIKLSVYAIRRQ